MLLVCPGGAIQLTVPAEFTTSDAMTAAISTSSGFDTPDTVTLTSADIFINGNVIVLQSGVWLCARGAPCVSTFRGVVLHSGRGCGQGRCVALRSGVGLLLVGAGGMAGA